MANFLVSSTVNGLQEFDFVVPTTDVYNIQGTLQLPNMIVPTAAQGAGGGTGTGTTAGIAIPSQVVTVVKVNSTTKYTSTAGDRGFLLPGISCTAGDTIKVILSSSLAQDNQPNAVKCTISISEGAY